MKNTTSIWKHALFLPLCACALTACGGGGGGGGGGSESSKPGTPSTPAFDASDWAAHPGAAVAADLSTVQGEPLAGKKLTVIRMGNGDGTDTRLEYKFTPGKTGSYTQTTGSSTETGVISSYTYTATGKTVGTLKMDIVKSSTPTRHEYTINFSSATTANGTLTIDGSNLPTLTLTFGK